MVVTLESHILSSLIDSVCSGSASAQEDSLQALEQLLLYERGRARRFNLNRAEAAQAVRLGIMEGARTFDSGRGVPAIPYLRLIVRRSVDKASRQNLASLSVTETIEDFEARNSGCGLAARTPRAFESVDDQLFIEAVRSCLSNSQNRFLDALVEHDFNASDAARSFGLTPSAGHKILSRIRSHVHASDLAA